MDKVDFGLTTMALNEEVGFGMTKMALNGGSRFWPDCNCLELEWGKLVLAGLKWLGIEEVDFGLTGIAWNGESRF
jgi:hypothetical protein